MFTNNILNEDQAKQIEENIKKDLNLVLNENEKIFNSINQKNWSELNKNQINNELSDLNKLNNQEYKNNLNNNSINIFNNLNNLIDNKNGNSLNINNSNLFNITKINNEKDIEKETLKNHQIIPPNDNFLNKLNNEPISKIDEGLINNKQLNNTILPNNERIQTINNLISHNNNLLINPSNNLLINPNNYFLNGYYQDAMNNFIFPGLNQFPLFYPFQNSLLYFPINNARGISSKNPISFPQSNETGLNYNKENPINLKENKSELIGKKKSLE